MALAGCMRGMQCGRSASAVGDAATSAVVTAIVGIILATAVITLLCNFLGNLNDWQCQRYSLQKTNEDG